VLTRILLIFSLLSLPADAQLATVTISSTSGGSAIPAQFLGLSTGFVEASGSITSGAFVPSTFGQSLTGTNHMYRQLVNNLTSRMTAPMLFRINGDISYATGVGSIQAAGEPLKEFAMGIGGGGLQYVLGVDMYNNSSALAAAETTQWLTTLPSADIKAWEIGNEPDNYPFGGARNAGSAWYAANGHTYAFADWLSQYNSWRAAVDGVSVAGVSASSFGTQAPVMGALGGGYPFTWLSNLQTALTGTPTLSPSIVGQHFYLGDGKFGIIGTSTQSTNCAGQDILPLLIPPNCWYPDQLLLPYSINPATSVTSSTNNYTTGYANATWNAIPGFISAAHAQGNKFRLSELNSFYNGGLSQSGNAVSNGFQAALWAIDFNFTLVHLGADGVNWHTGQYAAFELFQWNYTGTNCGWAYRNMSVKPLYYGLLFFSQMTGNNTSLLTPSVSTSNNVSVWATVDGSGSPAPLHVAIVNKDEAASGVVPITVPSIYGHATVRILAATGAGSVTPAYNSTAGLVWAGQTFDGSVNGLPVGTYSAATLTPSSTSGSTNTFTVPTLGVTSAALVDFAP
jgi:hypothetical protein